MTNKLIAEFMVRGTDATKGPESLALYLSNGNACGLAWFTVTAYELIPGDEPEIYIHAGQAAYILRFSPENDPKSREVSPTAIVFGSLCKREVESLKVGGPLLSIILTSPTNATGETIEVEEPEETEAPDYSDEIV